MSSLAEYGLARFSGTKKAVGAGILIDPLHIMTCAHVINAASGRDLREASSPESFGEIAVRVDGDWTDVTIRRLVVWEPLTAAKTGDIAILEIAGPILGACPAPLKAPRDSGSYSFATHGFPDGFLIGATGVVRQDLTIGQEWIQLEDEKVTGRAVTEGFSGAPVWDVAQRAVVGMVIAKDAALPAAKIAAMFPVTLVNKYWKDGSLALATRVQSDTFDSYWDPRARGVETRTVPGDYFTGRHRVLRELIEWVSRPVDADDNLRIVTGGPGSGKSGILARLVTASDPAFRERHRYSDDDPVRLLNAGTISAAVHALDIDAPQVMRQLSDYLSGDASDVDSFVELLSSSARTPFNIVIDGVDESTDPSVTAAYIRQLATAGADHGLRIIVGTRPGYQKRWLKSLGRSASRNSINIDNPRYLNRGDIVTYVYRRLLQQGTQVHAQHQSPYINDEALARQVAAAVAHRAHPSFLIAALTSVGLVRKGTVIDVQQQDWDEFPDTVAAAMSDYLEKFPMSDRLAIEDLLRPLAFTFGEGLPPDFLWAQLATTLAAPGINYSVGDIGGLLMSAASDYLVEEIRASGESSFRIYHQALVDHLRERAHPDVTTVAGKVYTQLISVVPQQAGRKAWVLAHDYVLRHLPAHAAEAGFLSDILADIDFLMAVDPHTMRGSVSELSTTKDVAARVYRTAAHLLSDPDDRPFQLQLNAARLGADELFKKFLRAETGARPQVAWIHEQFHTPHDTVGQHSGRVLCVAIGEFDGSAVAIAGDAEGAVRSWELGAGTEIFEPLTPHRGAIYSVAFDNSADGSPLIVIGDSSTRVSLWDLLSGERLREDPPRTRRPLSEHEAALTSMVGLVGERLVNISALANGTVVTYVSGGTEEPDIRFGTGYWGEVYGVAFGDVSPRLLAITGNDAGEIQCWNMLDANPKSHTIGHHFSSVLVVGFGFLQGNPVVISGDIYGTIRTHNPIDARQLFEFAPTISPVLSLSVGEVDGRGVVVSGHQDGSIWAHELQLDGPSKRVFRGHASDVLTVALGRNGGRSVIVSGSSDKTIRLWDYELGFDEDAPAYGHRGGVRTVAIGALDGKSVAVSASYDGTVEKWQLQDGTPISEPFTSDVRVMAVSLRQGQQQTLFGGGADGALRVMDLSTGALKRPPLYLHRKEVVALTCVELNDRTLVVTCSDDRTVTVTEFQQDVVAIRPIVHKYAAARSVTAWVTGGRAVVAYACEDGRIFASGLSTTGVGVKRLEVDLAYTSDELARIDSSVLSLAMSEVDDVLWLAIASYSGRVQLRNLKTGTAVWLPIPHIGAVPAVAFGRYLGENAVYSGGVDGCLKIWRWSSNTVRVLELGVPITSLGTHDRGVIVGHDTGIAAVSLEPAV